MSCNTLSAEAVRLNVSLGSLPEGFCPSSMQELGDAIATRLIVSPTSSSSSFAVGPIAPTSNVGPWLKDCLRWYVYDDATASYVPIAKGGFDEFSVYSANSTYTVPADIFKIMIEGWGAGGGGSNFSAGPGSGGGGGGGGYGKTILDVVPGDNIMLVIGTGGSPGLPATAGTNTVVTGTSGVIMTIGGGTAGDATNGGGGGTVTGAEFSIRGGAGGSAVNIINMGGAAPQGGSGGVHASPVDRVNGTLPGGGGCGGASGINGDIGGTGANGQIIIWT